MNTAGLLFSRQRGGGKSGRNHTSRARPVSNRLRTDIRLGNVLNRSGTDRTRLGRNSTRSTRVSHCLGYRRRRRFSFGCNRSGNDRIRVGRLRSRINHNWSRRCERSGFGIRSDRRRINRAGDGSYVQAVLHHLHIHPQPPHLLPRLLGLHRQPLVHPADILRHPADVLRHPADALLHPADVPTEVPTEVVRFPLGSAPVGGG